MSWRRAVLVLAIIAAHVAVVWLFPVERGHESDPPEEIAFATLSFPERQRDSVSATPASGAPADSHLSNGVRWTHAITRLKVDAVRSLAGSSEAVQAAPSQSPAPATTDWDALRHSVGADQIEAEVKKQRQADALSSWKSRIDTASQPAPRNFSWDFAATHRLQSTAQGLTVNLNDRCSLIISLYMMAVMGGCKIGEIPVRGDLFDHMRDEPGTSAPVTH